MALPRVSAAAAADHLLHRKGPLPARQRRARARQGARGKGGCRGAAVRGRNRLEDENAARRREGSPALADRLREVRNVRPTEPARTQSGGGSLTSLREPPWPTISIQASTSRK